MHYRHRIPLYQSVAFSGLRVWQILILTGLYINSLALQAVLEQWTNKVNETPQMEGPISPTSSISSSYASLYNRNEPYIREVINSSRIVLRHVVEGLLPNDQLKHAPVRTYFRIVSAAMFLLKVSKAFYAYHG